MRWRGALRTVALMVTMPAVSGTVLWSQGRGEAGQARSPSQFLAPPAQVVAVRAGRLFDPKSGTLLNNQVILIRGDKIADVGAAGAGAGGRASDRPQRRHRPSRHD